MAPSRSQDGFVDPFGDHAVRDTSSSSSDASESSHSITDGSPASSEPVSPVYPSQLKMNERTPQEEAHANDPDVIERTKRNMKIEKYGAAILIAVVNIALIFSSWWWTRYYYIFIPFVSLPLMVNIIMIVNILVMSGWVWWTRPQKIAPATPESMVMLIPCYNETLAECTRSLDSLVRQINIDQHKKVIMVICDGQVRGPGMEKTTAAYLSEDILAGPGTRRELIRNAYIAWDGQAMDVECVRGLYKGVPTFCILKQHNQGKRDSLIVIRSFIYNFNRRAERPRVLFAPVFFEAMSNWLHQDAGFDSVDVIIGMDADTVFEEDCIEHLIEESHWPNTVGVSGFVAVDYLHGTNFWSIYQNAEYTIAQTLRRLHQSFVTHKVNCLPGCCQLLKVCEQTCGDKIMIDRFGYYPRPTDRIIKRIQATASEDRNHIVLMFIENPEVEARQALKARALTDVPQSLNVFLSQRRRWTLGASFNDMLLVGPAPWRFNLFERFVSLTNVIVWVLNFFIVACVVSLVYALIKNPAQILLIFIGVSCIPFAYYIVLGMYMGRGAFERFQFMLGFFAFILAGPFINVLVTMNAIYGMDNVRWGKTRQVISEGETSGEAITEKQRREVDNRVQDTADEESQINRESVRTPFAAGNAQVASQGVLVRPGAALIKPGTSESLIESRLGMTGHGLVV